ncbi:MAG: UvrD-helicase domain-containing protein, partial [Alphaproteobacteria bacterium]
MSDPFYIEEPQETGVSEAAPVPYLAQLNAPQREAVEALDGPVLVLAGAGTGKTRVLTTRLAHLLRTGQARPYQVLAVTFTNRAAREMRERVADLVGGPAEAIWLGTFHALGARILRRHAELVGLKNNFTILDADDQVRLLKQLLEAENIDDKRWPARVLMGLIQRWKDRALTPEKVSAADAGDLAGGRLIDLYTEYQTRLQTLNAADFGDLLLHNLTIFSQYPEVLADYQDRFRYFLVDEYQDTNVAQYLWLRLLAQRHRNIA